ncbi:MAG: GGDEF domain-containing protein [Butyrivibrio sp.]|nr:GGDEF domain-containing protein [Butyrivibrio sp.]
MNRKMLSIGHVLKLCKTFLGMSCDERDTFYQYKCLYYQFFIKLALTGGCMASIMYIISDYQINGSFMPTLVPRFSILLPLILFWILDPRIHNYKYLIFMDYTILICIQLATIWSVYYLQDKTHFSEGTITMHIIFFTVCLASRFKDTLYTYLVFYFLILFSYFFNHYDNLPIILSLNIPCSLAILFAQGMLSLVALDHYLMLQNLEKLTVTDELTQLGNRAMLEDIVEEDGLSIMKPALVVMIDIDHFKQVNDKYGHMVGDEVLKYLAEYMKKCVRREDYVIRFGGEEFLILLNNCLPMDGIHIIEKIRSDISLDKNRPVPFTISAGISEYIDDYNDSVKKADEALYEAKNTGRNKTVMYTKK